MSWLDTVLGRKTTGVPTQGPAAGAAFLIAGCYQARERGLVNPRSALWYLRWEVASKCPDTAPIGAVAFF